MKMSFHTSLDTSQSDGVNSHLSREATPCAIISTKGAHGMSMFVYSTTLIFSPKVADLLPSRSAPVDHP